MNSLLKYLPNATSKSFLTVAILLGLTLESKPQNLVPNGGFEEVINCPETTDAIHFDCAHWFKSILLPGTEWYNSPSPDWFHTCSQQDVISPPFTPLGYQEPFDGDAYAGFYSYAENIENYREILGVQLLQPLAAGETYVVSFRLVKAFSQINAMSTNKIGVKFSNQQSYSSSASLVNNYSSIFIDSLVGDTLNWNLFEFNYEADSNYSYMHIGNFFEDDQTQAVGNTNSANVFAYYFLDDVSITHSILNRPESHEINFIKIFPNPSSHSLIVSYSDLNLVLSRIEIYDYWGRVLQQIDNQNKSKESIVIDISTLRPGIYFIRLKTDQHEIRTEKIQVY